jgi:hypothetical protein
MKLSMRRIGASLGLVLALAACDHNPPRDQTPQLPGALADQVAALNARSLAVQTLKARGRLSLEWQDRDGHHRQSADAVLLVQRQLLVAPANPANGMLPLARDPEALVALIGSFSGTEVLEMGVNAQAHWMAFHTDPKRAYVGKVGLPRGEKPANPAAADMAPFRADRVLEVLGLSVLGPRALAGAPAEGVAQRARIDSSSQSTARTVTLIVYQPAVAESGNSGVSGTWWKQREIVLSKATGRIEEIRTFHPDGSPEAVARLSEYYALKTGAKDRAGDDATIWMAHRIQVDYPGRHANVDLALSTIRLNVEVPAKAFELPDFQEQGLPVVDVDRP